MQMFYHGGQPYNDKRWKKLWMFFNPGCEASVQVSCENTFNKDNKNWISLGDATSGVVEYNFPPNTRSKLLFVKISESSANAPFTFYGLSCDFEVEGQNR